MRYHSPHEELVVAGLHEPISLDWLHDHFEYDLLDMNQSQDKTLEMIRYLVDQGLFVIGTPANPGYHQWLMPLDEAIDEIKSVYIGHFAERSKWADNIQLHLTAKGRELGRKLYR